MPQELYTGQGFRAPQMGDRALQALTQFGQQEQQRKTAELRQAFADRDKIAELMKIDPVYTTSQKANELIYQNFDQTIDKLTTMTSERKGPLTAKLIGEMQKVRGEAIAYADMLRSTADRFNQAYEMVARYPGKYNIDLLDDSREQWERSLDDGIGLPPEGPLLLPAVQNPLLLAYQGLGNMGIKWTKDETYLGDNRFQDTGYWDLGNQDPQMIADMVFDNPMMQYHVVGSFADDPTVPNEVRDRMIKSFGGNEALAANKYYKNRFVENLRGRKKYAPFERRPYASGLGAMDRYEMKYTTNFEEGWIGDATSGKRDVIYDFDTKDILFTNEITEPEVSVPVGVVKFDKDVDLGDMEEIKMIPKRGKNGKIYWEVADDVYTIKTGLTRDELQKQYPEKWDKGDFGRETKEVIVQEKGLLKREKKENITLYSVKVKLAGLTARTNYDDVDEILNAKYRQELRPFWRYVMSEGGRPETKEEFIPYTEESIPYTEESIPYTEESIRELMRVYNIPTIEEAIKIINEELSK